jgi:hypothetical protein
MRKTTAGAPLTCRPSQTLVCWNEDPPPGDISARVHRTSTYPVGTSCANLVHIPFEQERWDTNNFWDLSQPTRLTIQTPGKYFVYGNVRLAVYGRATSRIRGRQGQVAQGRISARYGNSPVNPDYPPGRVSTAPVHT